MMAGFTTAERHRIVQGLRALHAIADEVVARDDAARVPFTNSNAHIARRIRNDLEVMIGDVG